MTIFNFPIQTGQNKNDKSKKRPASNSPVNLRWALGAGTVLILSFFLSMHLLPDKISLQIGDISIQDIRAHRTVQYQDTTATEKLRRDAASHADKVYNDVPNASFDASANITNTFDLLQRAREDESLSSVWAKAQYVSSNLRFDISYKSLALLLKVDSNTFDQIRLYTEQLVKSIMSRQIPDDTDDAKDARDEFGRRLANYLGNERYAVAVSEIGNSIIRPNRIFDSEGTRKERQQKIDAVQPQYRQIFSGDLVIAKGQRVTPEHLDKFTALGLRHPTPDYVTMMCISLMVTLVVVIIILYIMRYHSAVYASTKLLLLLSIIIIFSVFGLKLGGSMLKLQLSGVEYSYFAMIWISTAGMLTAVLINPQLAILVVSVLATTSGLAMNHELRWALGALLSSLVAIYSVSDIRNRSDLIPAAVSVCLANLAMVWLIGRISGDTMTDLLGGSGWAIAGGAGSIMLFWFATTALEKPFGITTHNRLVELSDTNNPMLKRLLMEAPGTYSHGIYVGHIASTAAELINADALLVRVAAYYHDIGKIKRPHFFVENQHVENVHDRLNPSLSALVIRSHIKDGLDLAREYKLPPLICELMSQHHGSSLVKYFYYQAAVEASGGTAMLEQQFRYDGVKPQSKEAALLMLADSVEAASRSLSKPTPGQIESMVEGIISEKLSDGQLDESELTFKDISKIRESFIRSLSSMMHARIEYPDLSTLEGKKPCGSGNNNKELPVNDCGSEKTGKSSNDIASL
ncbi:MAG: HD family phosphohydrolase [Armatimonadota bacterium]